ncbi:MAG: SdrD B-like domain-containing protein [Patescibacteria group bacterium]
MTKFNDENGNGNQDEGEEVLPGWGIQLKQGDIANTQTTDTNGATTFGPVLPGEYVLSETIQDGWVQTNIFCNNDEILDDDGQSLDNDNSHPVTVGVEEVVTCNIGNQFVPPVLQISKDNDSGAPEAPGNSVLYTITVTAPEGNTTDVEGVTVTDLPPAGVAYDSTVDISSNFGGGHIGALTLSSPYASPGVWSLGDMQPGEIITIVYKAIISSSQDAGTYEDLAYARGTSEVGGSVLANADEETPFVGTDVEVVLPGTPVDVALTNIVDRDVDTKTVTKTKRVLGAATVLPYTGANINTILFALMLLLGGLLLMLLSKRSTWNLIRSLSKSMTKVFLFAVIGSLLLVGSSASAASGDLNVQIEQPKAVINSPEFKVGFVVLDISADDPIDVECEVAYEAGPFGEFDTYTLAAGGSSGDCVVTATDMPADGTYTFQVTAEEQEGGDSDVALAASIELVSGAPSTPLNYSRTSCMANFTTANDGLTDKVELYRSLSSTFTADASTLVITSASIGPNVASTLTDPNGDCGGNYFYAIRAVALSGLGSGFVGDERVVIDNENEIKYKTKTKKVTGPTTTLGAIPVTGGGAGTEGTVEGAATTGEEAVAPETGAEGSVLGAMNEGAAGFWGWIKNHPWWTALILLVLIALGYYAYQRYLRKHDENDQPR